MGYGGWLVNGVCPTDRNQKCWEKWGFVTDHGELMRFIGVYFACEMHQFLHVWIETEMCNINALTASLFVGWYNC